MMVEQQLPDGRWVPATPEPFWEDVRPWYVRVWHVLLFWRDDDELMDEGNWYIPCEPPLENLDKKRG